MDTPMKLSAAMRAGAKIRQQTKNAYFDHRGGSDEDTTILHSCAMGAALEAVGGEDMIGHVYSRTFNIDDYRELLGVASWSSDVEHPTTHECSALIVVITDLNDRKGWKREEIADWLESLGY